MFENILIFISITIIGAALLSIASEPTWHGSCSKHHCKIEITLS